MGNGSRTSSQIRSHSLRNLRTIPLVSPCLSPCCCKYQYKYSILQSCLSARRPAIRSWKEGVLPEHSHRISGVWRKHASAAPCATQSHAVPCFFVVQEMLSRAFGHGATARASLFSCCAPQMERRSQAVRVYLALYDVALFLGWATVATWMLMRVGQEGLAWLSLAWAELYLAMYVMQALVLVDVIHGVIGFWGSSDIPLLKRIWCKVGRRTELFVTLTLLHLSAHTTPVHTDSAVGAAYYSALTLSQWALGATFVTWAVTDVVRYPFYACSSLGLKPSWLVWLRYSVFVPQYPAVVLCELFVVCHALPAQLQMGFLPVEGPFDAWMMFGGVFFPPLERICLVNYAWIAWAFQVRNVALFNGYFATLWKVRQTRLGYKPPDGDRVALTPKEQEIVSKKLVQLSALLQRKAEKQKMDELMRCDVPAIAMPPRLRRGR